MATALFAYRAMLLTPGWIGRTWDWGLPLLPEQLRAYSIASLYAWLPSLSLGSPAFYPLLAYYRLLLYPLAPLGGAVVAKLIIVGTTIAAGWSVLALLRVLHSGWLWATVGAILFMLSPALYSRLVAGHIDIAFGLAIAPLFLATYIHYLRIKPWRPSALALTSIIFALAATHPLVLGNMVLLLLLVTVWSISFSKTKRAAWSAAVVLAAFAVLHSFWILPFLNNNFIQRQGNFSTTYTTGDESLRLSFLGSMSQNLVHALSLTGPQGLATESAYPVSSQRQFLLTACAVAAFGCLGLVKRRERFDTLMWTFAYLLGVTLVAGLTTPLGKTIYLGIFARLGPVLFEFANPNRFALMVTISESVLFALSGERLSSSWSHIADQWAPAVAATDSRKAIGRWLFTAVALIIGAAYVLPLLKGDIIAGRGDGSQPLRFSLVEPDPGDQQVYHAITNATADYRVTFLPPTMLVYPGRDTRHVFPWNALYLPNDEFLASPHNSALGRFVASLLYQPKPLTTRIGQLLRLAAVRFIVLPKYAHACSYVSFGWLVSEPCGGDWLYQAQGIAERNWSLQEDVSLYSVYGDTQIFQVDGDGDGTDDRIFASRGYALIAGDLRSLIGISYLPDLHLTDYTILFADVTGGTLPPSNFIRRVILPEGRIEDLLPFAQRGVLIVRPDTPRVSGWERINIPYAGWGTNLAYSAAPAPRQLAIVSQPAAQLIMSFPSADFVPSLALLEVSRGPDGGPLTVSLDGNILGTVDTYAPEPQPFAWVRVGPDADALESGIKGEAPSLTSRSASYSLTITNVTGHQAIRGAMLASADAWHAIRQLLDSTSLTLLYELERYAPPERVVDIAGASQGEAAHGNVAGTLSVPSPGDYHVLIRAQGHQRAQLAIGQDLLQWNTDEDIESTSTATSFKWYDLGKVTLPAGQVPFWISTASEEPSNFVDMLVLERGLDSPPPLLHVARLNPTHFRVTADHVVDQFVVNFSENFNIKWVANIDREVIHPIVGYGFLNSYPVDQSGSLDIELEYSDQRLTSLGWTLSLGGWLALALAVLVGCVRRFRASRW